MVVLTNEAQRARHNTSSSTIKFKHITLLNLIIFGKDNTLCFINWLTQPYV